MTLEPHEDGWRALAETLTGDAEPSELTDLRIIKEAARIASQRRGAAAPPRQPQRWKTMALAASLALVAVGFGTAVVSGRFGGPQPGSGDDMIVPADAGQATSAPAPLRTEVLLQFAPDGISLLPSDQDELAAAISQIDPCSARVRLRLEQSGTDPKRASLRAEAVAAALRNFSGSRCKIIIEPAAQQHDRAQTSAILVISLQ